MRPVLLAIVVGCTSAPTETELDTGEVETAIVDSTMETMPPAEDSAIAEADAPIEVPRYDLNHLLGTGQSLSVGAVGSPPLNTMQPYGNLMFSRGVIPGGTGLDKLVPLIETTVETMSSGLANNIAKDHVALVSLHGVGGVAYAGLKKGTTPYANGMAQVRAAKALAGGKTYAVRVVTNVHGESDHLNGNKLYGDNLLQWQADYEADIKAITGQSGTIPMLHTQMSSWTKYGQATSLIPQAQLDASRRSGGKLILVGPKYTMAYVSDGVHLSNIGYRLMGEYYAKVYRRVILEGRTWSPLQPRTITRVDKTITIELDVPTPPLELDTVSVTDPGQYGFEVIDDVKPAKILSLALAGPTSVRITLVDPPSGKAMRVRYAYTGTAGAAAGARTGPRGNLRDSDNTPSAYSSLKLYNWCVHFDEPVI